MTFFLLLLVSYLLGAVPFGVLVARARGVDILHAGSGNIGATNVGRVLGKGPGLAVWALDVLKSLLPTLVARALLHGPLGPLDAQTQWFLVGAAAILGHCASPFLGFKGGKGISTALGAIVGAAPLVALLCFALFAVVLATVRYMAVASTVGVASVVVFALLLGVTPQLLPVFVLLAGFVAYRHRSNFRRLREGTEPRFSFKKAGTPPEGGSPDVAMVSRPSSLAGAEAEGTPNCGLETVEEGGDRLRLDPNPQLPDPYPHDASHAVQIADSILAQFLASNAQRATLTYEPGPSPLDEGFIRIRFDDQDNGQLPMDLASNVQGRLGLVAGMDPLKRLQPRFGRITGTFDGEPFEVGVESLPVEEGVAFALARLETAAGPNTSSL